MNVNLRQAIWIAVMLLFVGLGGSFLFAQGLAAAAEGTVLEPGPTNEWGASVVWAYLSSVFLQQWKGSGVPGFSDQHTAMAKKAVAWLMALASAAGIHASFDAASGVLTITGLLWSSVLDAGGETLRQYVFQQIAYHGVVSRIGKEN